jgi:hypothetical protein
MGRLHQSVFLLSLLLLILFLFLNPNPALHLSLSYLRLLDGKNSNGSMAALRG